ncbi:MAG TPA: PepSY domain-containing protein [Albidovulum sp.]|uniref:PepSY domain-containing protein n=1 Tax=Albidovulum sp. TaxID=1872424 RepID=UPI002BFFDDBF|nr:PepSY domain-containing protein [Albidovulum sp.]
MKLKLILAAALVATPMAVFAMPKVGDVVGTKPEDATAALEKAGCKVGAYEAEGGKVEAKCTETGTGKTWEVYIDPKTGAVVDMKETD